MNIFSINHEYQTDRMHCSDTHFGDANILRIRDRFSSIEEHDSLILDQIAKMRKKDILHMHGDILFDSPNFVWYMNQFRKMSCRIKIIMGNHDSRRLYREDKVEIQSPLYTYKSFWLSHCPIHPDEMRNRKGNIHGHTHSRIINSPEYFNVALDVHDFKFVPFEEIVEYYSKL